MCEVEFDRWKSCVCKLRPKLIQQIGPRPTDDSSGRQEQDELQDAGPLGGGNELVVSFRSLRRFSQGLPDGIWIFQTKNANLGKFCRVLKWIALVYFVAIWSILRPFGIIYVTYVTPAGGSHKGVRGNTFNTFSTFWGPSFPGAKAGFVLNSR
jgi:hypothetical protein